MFALLPSILIFTVSPLLLFFANTVLTANGSGKSTFLKCIYRILKPDKGCILLDNEHLNRMSIKESAKKMAVVSQHNYYNFDFSVEEVVLMGRSPHKKSLERDNARDYEIVRDSLEKVGMYDFRKRSFSTLSGGCLLYTSIRRS